jgi:hypothetical protein
MSLSVKLAIEFYLEIFDEAQASLVSPVLYSTVKLFILYYVA